MILMTGESIAGAVLQAAVYAAERHRTQRRKDAEASPYINHPLAVADVLARHGVEDVVVLQAALLHDVIEDTETTAEDLGECFGADVLSVVLEVTDDKSLEKSERKRLQVNRAKDLSHRARLVMLADKICNVTDVASNPPAGWPLGRRIEYLDWTEAVIEGCRGAHSALERHYHRILAGARATVRSVDG